MIRSFNCRNTLILVILSKRFSFQQDCRAFLIALVLLESPCRPSDPAPGTPAGGLWTVCRPILIRRISDFLDRFWPM